MRCYIVLVSNGPSVLITELDTEGTVKGLIQRGFKNFNLYRVSEQNMEEIRKFVGANDWDLISRELDLEWPVRVVERDNAKAFHCFQMYANGLPSAIIRDSEFVSR